MVRGWLSVEASFNIKATFSTADPRLQHDYPTPSVNSTSRDTTPDLEAQRESARSSSLNSFVRPASGVSVTKAEAGFAELQRELSSVSEKFRLSQWRGVDYGVEDGGSIDAEKTFGRGLALDDGLFDLESTLRGNRIAENRAGIKPKHIGVIWRGLTVTGAGGVRSFVKTFPDGFISFFNVLESVMSVLGISKKGHDISVLTDFRGVAKPGEMILVLGRLGSGCTTFLKVISNQRFGYSTVTGDVMYGLFDAETFAKRYRGEATYNQV
jgi:ATP-binding cassette, subfamily G (WHITE), member 2, SNQ2